MVQLSQYSEQIENSTNDIKDGDYVVSLVETTTRCNQLGQEYINNVFEVQEGDYKGFKLYDNLNINHDKEIVRNIAFSTLKKLGQAIGKKEPLSDTEELYGKTLIVTVKTKDDFTNITKYQPYSVGGQQPSAAPAGQASSNNGSFPFPK